MSEIIINVENVQKAFKSLKLAKYAGKQFIDIYKDFVA